MIRYFLFILLSASILVSCRSIKSINERVDIPNITENRLLKNIRTAELDYNTLYAKRLEVSIVSKNESNNVRASLKIKKDSFIQVSLTAPLGIEIARVLLTRDSIKFVNSFGKKYFMSDYRYFYDKLGTNIGFDCFQKMLTNTFFNFENCNSNDLKDKKYNLDRVEGKYVLSTLEEKELNRKIKKLYKKKRKNKDYALVLQKIGIDPFSFKPLLMSIEDMDEKIGVSVNYMDFKNYDGKLFPEKIVFKLFSEGNETNLEIKFVKLEFDIPVDSNFKISSKYKRIYDL